jgi:hypothetical protein
MIHSGSIDRVATAFFVGAGAMTLGGLAELRFGVRAEGQSLENIAKPLTAEEAEEAEAAAPAPAPPATAQDERIRARGERRRARRRAGLRRWLPGPGSSFGSPAFAGTAGTASRYAAMAEQDLDREVEAIAVAVADVEPIDRDQLRRRVHGDGWGPGRFKAALRVAVDEGRAGGLEGDAQRRTSRPRTPRGGAARPT